MVSLFFVVAAMIEFSIVVLLSRRENVKINSADNPDEIEKEESVLDLHYFNNKIFDTLFGQDQQFKFAEETRNKIHNLDKFVFFNYCKSLFLMNNIKCNIIFYGPYRMVGPYSMVV